MAAFEPARPAGLPAPSVKLAAGEAFVCLADLTQGDWDAGAASLLSADERERADRFAPVARHARREFERARIALRILLGELLGVDPRELRFQTGPFGKPALAPDFAARLEIDAHDLEFNVSHSGGFALLALSRGGPVGADLEADDDARARLDVDEMARFSFSEAEQRELFEGTPANLRRAAFFHGWARKEAVMKATGLGMNEEPRGFTTPLAPGVRDVSVYAPAANRHLRVFDLGLDSRRGRPLYGALACTETLESARIVEPADGATRLLL